MLQHRMLAFEVRQASAGGADPLMQKVMHLCRARGIVFQCSEIYGGLANAFDFGPLGAQMKKHLQDLWWRDFVQRRPDCMPLESSIILSPRVWEASGHVHNFTDPLVECKECHHRFRADKALEAVAPGTEACSSDMAALERALAEHDIGCPTCGAKSLSAPRAFNLLFRTQLGAVEGHDTVAYLRPETAQGVYVNFRHIQQTMRRRLPFGVGQVGKSFRNEISPGNFLFRTREFDQMELQYFVAAEEAAASYRHWVDTCHDWLLALGLRAENVRKREHAREELAHYAVATTDLEYRFPFGWGELWGVAHRGDYDLRTHMQASGKDLSVPDAEGKGSQVPCVIEPAVGVNRLLLALLTDAYEEETLAGEDGKAGTRIVMRLHRHIAPYRAAVLPLLKKPDLVTTARDVFDRVVRQCSADFDITGSIGKRYRRQDEVGTPMCITVDFETLENGTVTVRDRDTMQQQRVSVEEAVAMTAQ